MIDNLPYFSANRPEHVWMTVFPCLITADNSSVSRFRILSQVQDSKIKWTNKNTLKALRVIYFLHAAHLFEFWNILKYHLMSGPYIKWIYLVNPFPCCRLSIKSAWISSFLISLFSRFSFFTSIASDNISPQNKRHSWLQVEVKLIIKRCFKPKLFRGQLNQVSNYSYYRLYKIPWN